MTLERTQETKIFWVQLTPASKSFNELSKWLLSMYSSAAVLENKLALEEIWPKKFGTSCSLPPEIVISHVLSDLEPWLSVYSVPEFSRIYRSYPDACSSHTSGSGGTGGANVFFLPLSIFLFSSLLLSYIPLLLMEGAGAPSASYWIRPWHPAG